MDQPGTHKLPPAVEVKTATNALPPAHITVNALAARLTDNRSLIERGPVVSACVLSIPILGLALLACLSKGDGPWTVTLSVALASIFMVLHQTDQLDLQRTVLRNVHLHENWLGALSQALDWPDRRVRRIAALLLTERLPRVNADNADLFTRESRNCLYRRLSPSAAKGNSELTIAILQALPRIGTEEALPYVERLATRTPSSASGYRIGEIARKVQPLLEARTASQRAAEAAARAAEANTPAILLSSQSEDNKIAVMDAQVDVQMREFEAELGKVQSPGMRMGFLIATWFTIVPYCFIQCISQFRAGSWPAGLLFAALTLLCTQLYRFVLTDRHKMLAQRLVRIEDVRCIGRIAELLEWPDEDVRRIAIAALTRLLPRAKASDHVLRTPGQRVCLYKMLVLSNAARHSHFLVTVLKALEQIGDVSAVPYVEHLANARPSTARERVVCNAANDCVPYLLACSEQNRHSQMLLRASSASATGTDTLMRAAHAVETTDQEQLLRPGTGDGGA